jgi:glycosyltransferase involved in cell wall biosynthesis
MRILYFASAASIHSYRWISYFAKKNYKIVWVSLDNNIFKPLPNVDYIQVKSSFKIIRIIKIFLNFKKIILSFRPDIIHIHSIGSNSLLGLIQTTVPIIVTPWGSDIILGQHNLFKKLLINNILHKSKLITCDAFHMRELIKKFGIADDKIKNVNFGIDTKYFYPHEPDDSIRLKYGLGEKQTVISLRNFEAIYNVETLIKAIPFVLNKLPNTIFILVGKGSQESYLKKLANNLGVLNSVHFVGFVNNDSLPKLLSSANLYVSTSLSDAGIAASTAEAMACGLPVLITDSGENKLWIEDRKNGFLVPTKNYIVLSQRIVEILNNVEETKKIAKIGRYTIQQKNDYYNEMEIMNKLYHQVLQINN